jgi:xanthine dehydrogenase accessory factor
MRELLAELTAALHAGRPCVYCSVVETRGSTPQKAGAAMLVYPDGSQRGTLGGGCVEAEVRQRALAALAPPGGDKPQVLSFHLDDNYGWDDGLICGGRMTILADRLGTAASAYFAAYQDLIARGVGCTEAVVVGDNPAGLAVGGRFLFDADNVLVAKLADADPPDVLRERLAPPVSRPKPSLHKGVAFLPRPPRVTLLIVGGGHVGHAVAKLAAEVDFDVWVLDDRERYADAERFPAASRRIVGDIGRTLQDLAAAGTFTPNVYALIVTRGHAHDEEALYHLSRTPAGYVGMIGSKRKIRLIYEDLISRGVPEETLARIHSPLGLSIGSQTVPEIAVSIVAELIACRNLGAARFDLVPSSRVAAGSCEVE